MQDDKHILMLTQKNSAQDDPACDDLYMTGTIGTVLQLLKLPDGVDDKTAAAMMLKGLTTQYLIRQTYRVKAGDTIAVIGGAKKLELIKNALQEVGRAGTMPWIEVNADAMSGRLAAYPHRQDITDMADIREQLVVELYSK
jgi:ATP-dependent Lon protease